MNNQHKNILFLSLGPKFDDVLKRMYVYYGNTGCGVFKRGGTKLERFLHKNQYPQRKLLNFEFWINGELSKSAKI